MRHSGDQLADYRLVERVGADRREVWEAVDTRDDRPVMLKVLPHLQDPAVRERVERDAAALRAAAHPAIVAVEAIEEAAGEIFVRTAATTGTSLVDWVPRGGLDTARLLPNATLLADAVRVAHEAGVTHRELAPERVFVGDDGVLRVHDFGLSATDEGAEDPSMDPDDTPTLTLTRESGRRDLGYLSPEQIKNLPLDRATDVYSVGATLYWMATGVHPFHGETPADLFVAVLRDEPRPANLVRHDVPEGLLPILDRCLQKERKRRYASAAELHGELAGLA
jgi:serine/threonine protein kinase